MYATHPEMAARWEEDTPKDKKLPKYKGVENKEAHKADQERRRSSAAGSHDNRPRRERSRQDELRAAVKRSREED